MTAKELRAIVNNAKKSGTSVKRYLLQLIGKARSEKDAVPRCLHCASCMPSQSSRATVYSDFCTHCESQLEEAHK